MPYFISQELLAVSATGLNGKLCPQWLEHHSSEPPHLISYTALTWVPGTGCCTWPPSTLGVCNYSETPSCSPAPHWVPKQNLWKQLWWQLGPLLATARGCRAHGQALEASCSRCEWSLHGHCLWDIPRKRPPWKVRGSTLLFWLRPNQMESKCLLSLVFWA